MPYRNVLNVDTVINKTGEAIDVSSLEEKPLLLYFAASWCSACRLFLPKLIQFYQTVMQTGASGQVLFVSNDRDEVSFKAYFSDQPWLAIAFARRDDFLLKYNVSAFPTVLVLSSENGAVLTRNGCDYIEKDPQGLEYPWKFLTQNPLEILGSSSLPILQNDGRNLTMAALKAPGTYTALYFGAQWCPTCRSFCGKLMEVHKKLVVAAQKFHVIYVSWDRDKSKFDEVISTMPWAALPFDDARIKKLSSKLNVQGIPTVVMVDCNGVVVNENARGAILADAATAERFPWLPQSLSKVARLEQDDDVLEILNEKVIVLLITNGATDTATVLPEFTAAAEATSNPRVQYLVSSDVEFLEQITAHIRTPSSVTKCTVLCFYLPNDRAKEVLHCSEDLTRGIIQAFVEKFEALQQ